MLFALFLFANAFATCPAPPSTVALSGHPVCLQFSEEEEETVVQNGCEQPVLIDHSVGTTALLAAQESAVIKADRDFTVGVGGTLYRVVATEVEAGSCEEEKDTAEPEA
jgi:hypothetical protein